LSVVINLEEEDPFVLQLRLFGKVSDETWIIVSCEMNFLSGLQIDDELVSCVIMVGVGLVECR
jgi:hypothetical protein